MNVKNCVGLEHYKLFLLANKDSSCFMDEGRRHETLGPESFCPVLCTP